MNGCAWSLEGPDRSRAMRNCSSLGLAEIGRSWKLAALRRGPRRRRSNRSQLERAQPRGSDSPKVACTLTPDRSSGMAPGWFQC